jgi:PadR family transcriptional regulator, regulatory protein PadR
MSNQTLAVLLVFFKKPAEWLYGLQIIDATGLKSGTVYPLLARLAEDKSWLETQLEDIDPVVAGRKPRRFYRLTGLGESAIRDEMVLRNKLQIELGGVLHANI